MHEAAALQWGAAGFFDHFADFGFSLRPAKMPGMNKTVFSRLIVVGILSVVLAGCLDTSLPPAPPVSAAQLAIIRDQYRRTDAEARVGVVTAVLPSANLASVGSIPAKDFSVGDVISFIDSNQAVLTLGHVEAINSNSITVKYDPPDRHGREPLVGDMAVRAIH
jgi:hypothetical protein